MKLYYESFDYLLDFSGEDFITRQTYRNGTIKRKASINYDLKSDTKFLDYYLGGEGVGG